MPNPKPKKVQRCRICREPATLGGVVPVCSFACAVELAKRQRAKKEAKERSESKRETRERKEAGMTIGARLERARRVFQEWIRLRDAKYFSDKGLPTSCIDCGRTTGQFQGGHFITVGSRPELQFHPANCHAQLAQCNLFLSQSDSQYRDNLIAKVGLPMVEYLENYRAVIRWTAEEIEEIRAHYKGLTKELKNEHGHQWTKTEVGAKTNLRARSADIPSGMRQKRG